MENTVCICTILVSLSLSLTLTSTICFVSPTNATKKLNVNYENK